MEHNRTEKLCFQQGNHLVQWKISLKAQRLDIAFWRERARHWQSKFFESQVRKGADPCSTGAFEVVSTFLSSPWLFLIPPEITRRIDEAKRKMGRVMQIAAFSLAEVTYAVGGDIGYQIQESAKAARFRIRTKQENVSGVYLPQFESYSEEGNNDFGLTGLGKGGQQVQRCRETYARAVETLVALASLQVRWVSTHKLFIILTIAYRPRLLSLMKLLRS